LAIIYFSLFEMSVSGTDSKLYAYLISENLADTEIDQVI